MGAGGGLDVDGRLIAAGDIWGTVPAWVSTASVVVAALAFWQSAWDKKREQASKVAAWFEDTEMDSVFGVRIANNSDAPIYQVTVLDQTGAVMAELKELDPKSQRGWKVPLSEGTELSRRYIEAWDRGDGEEAERVADEYLAALRRTTVALHFRDALGRWWFRRENGKIRASRRRVFTPREGKDGAAADPAHG